MAADTGEAPICIEFSLDPAECTEGEQVEVAARDCRDGTWAGDSVTFALTSNKAEITTGTVGEDGIYRATYTCPEVECPGATLSLYVTVHDETYAEDWAFGQQWVACAEEPADTADPADTGEGDKSDPCGCDSGGAALAFGAFVVGLGVRARR